MSKIIKFPINSDTNKAEVLLNQFCNQHNIDRTTLDYDFISSNTIRARTSDNKTKAILKSIGIVLEEEE